MPGAGATILVDARTPLMIAAGGHAVWSGDRLSGVVGVSGGYENGRALSTRFRQQDTLIPSRIQLRKALEIIGRFGKCTSGLGTATGPQAHRASASLIQRPHLRGRHLAAQLEVSGRYLSGSFQAVFGMSAKRFAGIARIASVWSARGQGAIWVPAAYAARFTNFDAIVGVPPTRLVRPSCS